jgi:periplasmic copper chaperone A
MNLALNRCGRVAVVIVVVALIVSSNFVALAKDFMVGPITIEQPWSRATPGGAKVASGYFTIKNAGDSPDRLVSVTAEIAGRTGIHQMSMSDGMMQMQEVTEGLLVPANGSVALEPGSYHLIGLGATAPSPHSSL